MSYALALVLFSPLLILISQVGDLTNPFRAELFRVLQQTFLQASASSLAALILGLAGALGLVRVSSRVVRRGLETLVLLPSLLPTLFVLVAMLNLVTAFTRFPFGFLGVVLVHTVVNMGLVAVILSRRLESLGGPMIELATVEGVSRLRLLFAVLGALRADIGRLGFAIFATCFTAVSAPLIVGAGRGETIEVLIYRAVISRGDWSYGLSLAILQVGVVALFSWMMPLPQLRESTSEVRNLSRLPVFAGLTVMLLITAVLVVGGFLNLGEGLGEFAKQPTLVLTWVSALAGTFAECFMVGALSWLLLATMAYQYPHPWLHRVVAAVVAPSAAVMALALFVVFDAQSAPKPLVLFVISLGFAVLVWPALYRFRLESRLAELEPQIQVARVLGASRWRIFFRVVRPQIKSDLGFLAGVSALWASGDFVLASLVAGRELTLGIAAQGFLGGYRLGLAAVMTLSSLVVGLMVYAIFVGRSEWSDQKLIS